MPDKTRNQPSPFCEGLMSINDKEEVIAEGSDVKSHFRPSFRSKASSQSPISPTFRIMNQINGSFKRIVNREGYRFETRAIKPHRIEVAAIWIGRFGRNGPNATLFGVGLRYDSFLASCIGPSIKRTFRTAPKKNRLLRKCGFG